MKKIPILLLMLSFTLLFSGCKLMYRTLLGVNTQPDLMSYEELDKKSKRYGVDQESNYYLEVEDGYYDAVKELYLTKLETLDTIKDSLEIERLKQTIKNDRQPVQLRYFDAEGEATFKMVNCYVDPPIPMNWNVEGSLDQFPPKTPDIPSLKMNVNQPIDFFLPHIKNKEGKPLTKEQLPAADYYVILFWNSFFIRPSKKLIKQVKLYHKKHKAENVHAIYVNNHNAHLWGYLNEEQKEMVKEQMNSEE